MSKKIKNTPGKKTIRVTKVVLPFDDDYEEDVVASEVASEIASQVASYNVTEKSPIGFGKFKNQPHLVLLKPSNQKYAQWIIDQGPEFRYVDTRNWLQFKLDGAVKDLTLPEFMELLEVTNKSESQEKQLEKFSEDMVLVKKYLD
jgi:hypothetical protein